MANVDTELQTVPTNLSGKPGARQTSPMRMQRMPIRHPNNEDLAYHVGQDEDEQLTTAEAVRTGMAVTDGGATQTIGSVASVEAVMRQNKAKRGHSGLTGVNAKDPPVLSFGNSTENCCLSCQAAGHRQRQAQRDADPHPGGWREPHPEAAS